MKKIFVIVATLFTLATSWSCRTVVTERPGEPAVVARPAQPGPNYVWRGGEWYYRGGGYHWHDGYWTMRGNHKWVDGHWVHGTRGWYWRRGYWR